MSHTGEAGEAVLRGNQAVDLPGNLPLAMVGNQSHTEGKEMIQPQRRAQGMHRGKLERGGGRRAVPVKRTEPWFKSTN